jgi:hypothetical protein
LPISRGPSHHHPEAGNAFVLLLFSLPASSHWPMGRMAMAFSRPIFFFFISSSSSSPPLPSPIWWLAPFPSFGLLLFTRPFGGIHPQQQQLQGKVPPPKKAMTTKMGKKKKNKLLPTAWQIISKIPKSLKFLNLYFYMKLWRNNLLILV